MRTMADLALNGQALSEIDDSIVLQSINENAPTISTNLMDRGGMDGQTLLNQRRQYMDITLDFCIAISSREPQRRVEVLQKVNAWAVTGGWLTVTYRPNQRLRVVMQTMAAVSYAGTFDQVYSITWRAAVVPCWQDVDGAVYRYTASRSVYASIDVPGTAQAKLELVGVNSSGSTITNIDLFTERSTIKLGGLDLRSEQTFRLEYSDDDVQRITVNGQSVLSKRSTISDDELWVDSGPAVIQLNASGLVAWTVSVRGRWL